MGGASALIDLGQRKTRKLETRSVDVGAHRQAQARSNYFNDSESIRISALTVRQSVFE